MNATMATTLMSANQYSNSPNRLTGAVLMATNAAETHGDPDPLRHVGKPEGEVDGDRRHLRANRQHLDERVGRTDDEAEPWRQVALRVHAERTGLRVDDGHLRQDVADNQRNGRADHVREDHPGTGETDRHRTPEEQADADRSAHRDHRELAGCEAAAQAFVGDPRVVFVSQVHSRPYVIPKATTASATALLTSNCAIAKRAQVASSPVGVALW